MTWGIFATNAQRIQDENRRREMIAPVFKTFAPAAVSDSLDPPMTLAKTVTIGPNGAVVDDEDENRRRQTIRPSEAERSTLEDRDIDIELFGAPRLRTLPARPTKNVNQEWNNAFGKGRRR